jgi:hypothetical protein
MNYTMIVGYGKSEDVVYRAENIIAFHGSVDDDTIQQLGVTGLDP